jgi:hypothetical protein
MERAIVTTSLMKYLLYYLNTVAPLNTLPVDISIGHVELLTSVTQHVFLSAFWLAAFYYANLLLLMGISFLICAFFVYAHFILNATGT